jgi:hypothetical protein
MAFFANLPGPFLRRFRRLRRLRSKWLNRVRSKHGRIRVVPDFPVIHRVLDGRYLPICAGFFRWHVEQTASKIGLRAEMSPVLRRSRDEAAFYVVAAHCEMPRAIISSFSHFNVYQAFNGTPLPSACQLIRKLAKPYECRTDC